MASGVIKKVGATSTSNYAKFPDGTLIQWGYENTGLTVSAKSSGMKAVSFPLSFVNTNYVIIANAYNTSIPSLRTCCAMDSGKSVNWINIQYQNDYTGDWVPAVSWIAIGRWM